MRPYLSILLAAALLTGCRPQKDSKFLTTLQKAENNVENVASKADDAKHADSEESTTIEAGKGYELPANVDGQILLKRIGYTVSYNIQTKEPNWVAWYLSSDRVSGDADRNGVEFTEDEEVPEPRATTWDYYRSHFDRGHQCPAGDNKWNQDAMNQSFLLTNICPQNPKLNKYEWNRLESQCRDWAKEYGGVYIACGPIYAPNSKKTIGEHKVKVPTAFFKVVLCMTGTPKAIGFIYQNTGDKQDYRQCVRTVDEIEQLTGYDFFKSLDDKVEKRVEANANIDDWPQDRLDSSR
jgi:endonuclease G